MNPLMGNSGAGHGISPMQLMSQFMKNPVGALRQAGYTVPDGMNDPRQITNYLINNGQLTNSKLSQIQRMAQVFQKSR